MIISKKLPILITLLCLFMGEGTLLFLNYPLVDIKANFIFKIHPASYLLALLTILNGIRYKLLLDNLKPYIAYFVVTCVTLIFSLFLSSSKANIYILNTLITPVLVLYNFQYIGTKEWKKIFKLIKIFFYMNCTLAIFENFFKINIFPLLTTTEVKVFRSTAFQGHPLNNSLITVIVSIILYSFYKKYIYKILLIVLTTSSLIAFGSRSILAIYILSSFILLLNLSGSNRAVNLFKNIFLFLLMLTTIYIVLFNTSFGNRILDAGLSDNSAETRFDIFQIFDYMKGDEFYKGLSQKRLDSILNMIGLNSLENFWVVWVLKYGIFIATLLIFYLIKFLFRIVNSFYHEGKYAKVVLVLCFLFSASSNNSLATHTMCLNIFVLLCMSVYFIKMEVKNSVVVKIKTLNFSLVHK